jgi:hypothetical protein
MSGDHWDLCSPAAITYGDGQPGTSSCTIVVLICTKRIGVSPLRIISHVTLQVGAQTC